ncbi:aldo/keto reductase [Auraticoccus sp. F435]|uniref:Aldo/keto reductase n=1 Tax=Auraticoccus cholistanensis TaxID=2656650 RepID=A0A6A9V0T6_9ACTN|nr:aldo/keto reductase [Auraticoccus cholistanensis]MVA76209.1 aldo/keto reductase [Auraticoccus cholistanensis]
MHDRGVHPTPVALGTAQLGNLYQAIDDEQAEATVAAAWDGGIRYFDTAPHYGLGVSERRLGRALRERPRQEYVLSTKVGRLLRPNPSPTGRDGEFHVPDDLVRVWDFSAEGVRRSVHESLERLGLDHLDIAYIHDPDDHFEEAMAGAVPELSRLRDEGLVRAWGAGMNQAGMLQRFAAETDADVMMLAGRHTLLEQRAGELFATCRRTGVAVVCAAVFNSGVLAEDDPGAASHYNYGAVPEDVLTRVRAIGELCREFGTTLPAAAIAYPLREPAVVSVALGMQSPDHVRQNLARVAQQVPDELFEALDAAGLVPAPG